MEELETVSRSDVNADFTAQEKNLRRSILKVLIAKKLGIPDVGYMVDVIDELFTQMQEEIDDLNKFNKHRHKTIMGLYTEKPVY